MADATYWTGEVGSILRNFLKFFVCFAKGRARNFPLIPVDVLPREVVEILATKSGWTAKSTLSLRTTDPLLHPGWSTCVSCSLGWARVRLGSHAMAYGAPCPAGMVLVTIGSRSTVDRKHCRGPSHHALFFQRLLDQISDSSVFYF